MRVLDWRGLGEDFYVVSSVGSYPKIGESVVLPAIGGGINRVI